MDSHMDSAIDAAAAVSSQQQLQMLLEHNPQLLSATRADGWSALHLAAFTGSPASVLLLLERGASTELRSENATANTPLHAAIAGAMDLLTITALLDAESDVNATGGEDVTPLHLAAARGSRQVADHLLARGADPRARMKDGSMPFHLAAARGHESLALWLEGHAAP